MAIQFLAMLPMIMQGLSALSAASNVAKGAQPTAAENAQIASMANRDRLLKAYLNPDDNITKNITSAEGQFLNSQTQQQLSNLLAANRKARLMGRQTYFDPERQDESINRFMTNAIDTNANTARSNALQRILGAANGYQSAASGYGQMIPNQQAAQQTNNNRTPALLGAAGDAFKSGGSLSNIFSMLGNRGGGATSWLNPDTGAYQ